MEDIASAVESSLLAMTSIDGNHRAAMERQNGDPGATGWTAYAPLGTRVEDQPSSATPWRDVVLLDVAAVGPALIVTFRWLPTSQDYAHVSDLGPFGDLGSETAA